MNALHEIQKLLSFPIQSLNLQQSRRKNTLNIKIRFHALSRMFERNISEADVLQVLSTGKVIEDYPTDQPYPSCLKLGFVKNRPLHVVTAEATDEVTTVIITMYEPGLARWEPGFEKRK